MDATATTLKISLTKWAETTDQTPLGISSGVLVVRDNAWSPLLNSSASAVFTILWRWRVFCEPAHEDKQFTLRCLEYTNLALKSFRHNLD